jgi:hypothetical protein
VPSHADRERRRAAAQRVAPQPASGAAARRLARSATANTRATAQASPREFSFRIGTDITPALLDAARSLSRQNALDATTIERLRREAGSLSDEERLFLLALRHPEAAQRLSGARLADGDLLVLPFDPPPARPPEPPSARRRRETGAPGSRTPRDRPDDRADRVPPSEAPAGAADRPLARWPIGAPSKRVVARQALVSGTSVVEEPDDEHTSLIKVNGQTVLAIDLPPGTTIELKRGYQPGEIPSFSVLWIFIVLPPGGKALLDKENYQRIMSAAADRWSIRVDHRVNADLEGHVPAHVWTDEVHSDPEPPPAPDWAPPPPPKVPVFTKPQKPAVDQPAGPVVSKSVQETLEHMREGRWDTDDLAAQLTDAELAQLTPEERVALIAEIGEGFVVGDEDEETIDRLLETTPTSEYATVIGLMAARKGLFKTLDDAIDGDEYRRYIIALSTMMEGRGTPEEAYKAVQAAPVLPWTSSGFTREKATYTFDWLDDGRVQIHRWYGLIGMQMRMPDLELSPTDMVVVRFVYDEPEIYKKAGQTQPMPVAAFIALINANFRRDMWLGIQVALVVSGVGGIAGATTRLGILLATLDVAIGAASIGIDSYRAQIAATERGREFLKYWDIAQYVIAVYGLARVAMHIPQAIRSVRAAFNGARGAILEQGSVTAANDVDSKLTKLESALKDVEEEAKAHPPSEGPGAAPRSSGGAEPAPGSGASDPAGGALPTPPKKLRLMHGTDQAGFEGLGGLEKGKIDVGHAGGAHQDFGRGFYLATDQATAEAYGVTRNVQRSAGKGGGMTHVLAYDVSLEELGTVVDIRPGGNFGEQWQQFLSEPPFKTPTGYPPPGMATRREFIRGLGAERRGLIFEEFLQGIGKTNADVVVGPLGDDVFTGITAGKQSTQVCIRSQAAADKLNEIATGAMASKAGDVDSALSKLDNLGPGLVLDANVTLSPTEDAAARWWVSQGKRVRALRPAADTGAAGVRTADLDVEGVGRVDVYTPQASTGSNGVVRSIVNKSSQAPTVHVEMPAGSVVTDDEIARFPGRVFGNPTAGKGINRIVVRRGGRVVLDSTRRP